MQRVLVYASDALTIAGADALPGDELAPLSYLVNFETVRLRFHVKLAWKSELTFVCPVCRATAAPPWWKDGYLFANASILMGNYSDQAICVRCAYEAPFSLRYPTTYQGSPHSYHTTFTWSQDLKAVLEPFLDQVPGVDVLQTVLLLDELCEALIPIKGRLESERLQRARF